MITSRRICFGILLIALAVGSSGCFDSRSVSSPITTVPTTDKTRLKVAIDWEQFASHTTKGLGTKQMTSIDITHVGARLEYPSESAVFMQSVKREVAESIGVITMEVSPAERADLYLVAVMQGDGTWQCNRARYLGVIEGLILPERTTIDIRMDDIEWVEASWHLSEEDEAIWSSGARHYEAPASERYLDRPVIYVRDSFQVGREFHHYDDSLFRINGHSGVRENTNGWREFAMRAANSRIGEEQVVEYTFEPYVPGGKFNLPSEGGHYMIEPLDNAYTVHWMP